MLSLRELQLRFSANLLDSAGTYAVSQVVGGSIPPQERIGFYRTNMVSTYRDTLRAVYPVIDCLVGESFFNQAADRYTRIHPSVSGDLNLFGDHFADFLETYPPARALAYLADVARLERLVEESFYAADRPGIALADLSTVPPDRQSLLTFTLHPSCRLLASPHPVHRIWEFHQPDWQGPECIDLDDSNGDLLLVRRARHRVVIECLDHGGFCMLNLLMAGRNLDEAYRYAASVQNDFDLSAFLQHCVATGVLVDFDWPLQTEQPHGQDGGDNSLRAAA